MATTDAEICNLALSKIGSTEYIDALDEDTAAAQACSVLFPQSRSALLEASWWTFATRREELALTTETRKGFEYCYTAPADMMYPQFIYPDEQRIPFQTELNDAASGMLILTDAEEPELSFTTNKTKPVLYSALFTEALSFHLAARLSMALPVKPAVGVEMLRQFQLSLATAKAADAARRQKPPERESEYATARR